MIPSAIGVDNNEDIIENNMKQRRIGGNQKFSRLPLSALDTQSDGHLLALSRFASLEVRPSKLNVNLIPLDQMKQLMLLYGPETFSYRKSRRFAKEKSTRRRFSRWFPNFFRYFQYNAEKDTYEPVLGVAVEQERRKIMRSLHESKKKADIAPK
jgi:hypothetical protein